MTAVFHPEATADPRVIRWVVQPGGLPALGLVVRTPDSLAELVDAGVIEGVNVVPGAVEITLAPRLCWREHGPAVRTALAVALENPELWEVRGGGQSLLEANLAAVLAGPAGAYVASHGGCVSVDRVEGEDVWLRMGGACRHCPAVTFTVRGTIERELARVHTGHVRFHVIA